MAEAPSRGSGHAGGAGWTRAALVAAGIVFGQLVLYGPSLVGQRILLPLDLLAQEGWYLPRTSADAGFVPRNRVLGDQILVYEVERQFAVAELRAGRWPLWNPYNDAGTPTFLSYSPFNVLSYLLESPRWLAWIQLLKALVAGLGAYVFFRRVLDVGFGAAAVGGVSYPVTGFLLLWQGYPIATATVWFPWMLLATDRTVRRPAGWGGPALALVTGAVLSTSLGFAPQLVLASGVYALWCAAGAQGWRPRARPTARALAVAAAAWLLGLLLAMPYLLPRLEYAATGSRMMTRAGGAEERPPVGLSALPQVVFPDVYGSWQRDDVRIVANNRLASSATAYTGLVATLFLAPLAFASRRHRPQVLFWSIAGFVGLGWTLNVPGVVQLLRLPGLNMFSHDRWTFVASFAILSLAVIGLARIAGGSPPKRRWLGLGIALLVLLAGWNVYRSTHLPEPVASRLGQALAAGRPSLNVPDAAALERVRGTFVFHYRKAAALSLIAAGCWLALGLGAHRRPAFVVLVGALVLGDLLAFGRGLNPQEGPELYYPEVPLLAELAEAPPGRALCVDCLPPGLNRRFRLRDVRGYDAVDPLRLVELLSPVRDPAAPAPSYARLMWFRPRTVEWQADGVRLHPILDMLGVRYLIYRGSPPADQMPRMAGDDYWVVENPRALPRVYVPRRVATETDRARRLELLADADFDPRALALVEEPVALAQEVHGTAEIVDEVSNRITIALDMATPGLVVLADQWSAGWKASLDGQPVPILRANHAVRGVLAPAGASRLVFRYQPGSLRLGMALMAAALIALAGWAAALRRVGGGSSSPL